jgi:hypothetical protein
MLREAGIFMGGQINDAVYEDEEITVLQERGGIDKLRQIVEARNNGHRRWGFKYPMLWQLLGPDEMSLFDSPRLIVMFRDPVSIAVRASLSEYQTPMRALRQAIADQSALMEFIGQLACPNLLLSYEKGLIFPEDFIRALLGFCGIRFSAPLRARLLALIEPNRPRYLATARRPFEGLIDGVTGDQLYGWCWLKRVPEPVRLDVLVDDRLAASTVADAFRQDLIDAGIGHGRHGFFVPVEALHARPDSVIRVLVAPHGVELANSGTRLRDFRSAAA